MTGLGAAGAPNEPPKITRADLAQLGETVADAICACRDLACAQEASQRFAELSPRGSEQDLSSEDVARLTEAVRRMQACLDRLVEEHGSGGR